MIKSIVFISMLPAVVCFLDGCTIDPITGQQTIQLTTTEKQIGSLVIQYKTIQAINKSSDPAAAKARATTVLTELIGLINGDVINATLDALEASANKAINWASLKPADAFLYRKLIPLIKQDLADRLGVTGALPLTDPQRATVKLILIDLQQAVDSA